VFASDVPIAEHGRLFLEETTMIIPTQPKAYILDHPEYGITTPAEIVGKWRDGNGRFVGYRLRFRGEDSARHLTFADIRRLQGAEEAEAPYLEAIPCT
jgi:hypothetical protein